MRTARKTVKVKDQNGTTIGLAQQVDGMDEIEIRFFPGEAQRLGIVDQIRPGQYSIGSSEEVSAWRSATE